MWRKLNGLHAVSLPLPGGINGLKLTLSPVQDSRIALGEVLWTSARLFNTNEWRRGSKPSSRKPVTVASFCKLILEAAADYFLFGELSRYKLSNTTALPQQLMDRTRSSCSTEQTAGKTFFPPIENRRGHKRPAARCADAQSTLQSTNLRAQLERWPKPNRQVKHGCVPPQLMLIFVPGDWGNLAYIILSLLTSWYQLLRF